MIYGDGTRSDPGKQRQRTMHILQPSMAHKDVTEQTQGEVQQAVRAWVHMRSQRPFPAASEGFAAGLPTGAGKTAP